MENMHFVDPSRENFDYFKELDRNTPILMLNKLRFHAKARYESGHPLENTPLTEPRPMPTAERTVAPSSLGLAAPLFGVASLRRQ